MMRFRSSNNYRLLCGWHCVRCFGYKNKVQFTIPCLKVHSLVQQCLLQYPLELSALMELFYIYAAHSSTHQKHVATKHLKCGHCSVIEELDLFLIFKNLMNFKFI